MFIAKSNLYLFNIYKFYQVMLNKNTNLLKIDFDLSKGLILKWNLKGNLDRCFFRHILIFDVNWLQFDIQTHIFKYFRNIKLGDMITFACIDKQGTFYILRWKQKTPMTQLQTKKLKPVLSQTKDIIELLFQTQKRIEQFAQPTIFNLITQKSGKDLKQLQVYTKRIIQKKQSYFANIFAAVETSIQITTGVNFLNIKDFQEQESWNFLKKHMSQIALLKAKITIQCQNGLISSQKQSQWKTVEFNKITRQLKAPSINYLEDMIHFVNQEPSEQIDYVLNIKLQYKQLNNQAYSASKKVFIRAINQKVYQRTICGRKSQYGVQIALGVFSRQNPYKSQSLVWFKKNINPSIF